MSLYASPRSNQRLAGLLRPSDGDGIISIVPARRRHRRTAVSRYGDVPILLKNDLLSIGGDASTPVLQ